MTDAPPPAPDPLADAYLAAHLFALDPNGLGGLWLRGGDGPVRERIVALAAAALPEGFAARRLPLSIDDDRLVGGLDVGASLAAGRAVRHQGLLREAAGGLLSIAGAERIPDGMAGRLAAAMDADGTALMLLDDSDEEELGPPHALTDRLAFHLDLSGIRHLAPPADPPAEPLFLADVAEPSADVLNALAAAALAFGVPSVRTMLLALRAARASAAYQGRDEIVAEDVTIAARLVLVPSATRLPPAEDEPPPEEPPPPPDEPEDQPEDTQDQEENAELPPLEDLVLDAVKASLPPELFEKLAKDRTRGRGPQQRGRGARKKAKLRGRPIGARPGSPTAGLRLALVDTLRAAAPWQKIRQGGSGATLKLRKDDLRVRRFESRETILTIFAVDASGSAAFARLAEAKGAVELLLERAYAKRAEVALVAFRGTGAELLLPPTRSLTRARRLLAALPGGGGTPLAAGLDAACALADAQKSRGRTPQIVVLTDGKANIAADGSQSRQKAGEDAEAAARRIALSGHKAAVIDIGPRRQPEAAAVAAAMDGRYLHLPRADASVVTQAIA